MQASTLKLASATMALAALVAGCSDSATNESRPTQPSLGNTIAVAAGELSVCKFSVQPDSDPFANFLTTDPTSGTVRVLANGSQVGSDSVVAANVAGVADCRLYTLPAGTTTLDVTETPAAGSALYFYRYLINGSVQDPYANVVAGGPTPAAYTIHREGIDLANAYEIWLKNVPFTPPPPPDGCSYTQGYWKTHSARGPAPYDNAWANVGATEENTPFFISGGTWYSVFWTSPSGNPYYILAHQYMAAKLNILNGTGSTPEVDAAITAAEAFFAANTPAGTLLLTKTQQNALKAYATTLDQYNNGIIGPGHCSDEVLSN
jgi:hypothetical protein